MATSTCEYVSVVGERTNNIGMWTKSKFWSTFCKNLPVTLYGRYMTHKNANGLWNFKFPYLHKLDTVWGRDRATTLKAEDIAEACEASNNNDNAVLSSSSDTKDEVFVVTGTQNTPAVPSTSQTKKIRSYHHQQKVLTRRRNR
nr:Myb/SANT-like domain-containing protein [Tanacetum cinerariifolium]